MKRNYSLDFSRGLLAFCVAIGHYFYWNSNRSIPLSFILAVDYFFILSGFVLTSSVFNKKQFDSFDFAKARFLRLYPVYIFSILFTLIIILLVEGSIPTPRLGDIFRILVIGELLPLVQTSGFNFFEPLGISWSISAEFWVGIIFFPILYVLHKKINQLVFPFLMLSILICLVIVNNYSPEYMNIHYIRFGQLVPFGLIRALLGYALGAFSYFIIQYIKNDNKVINTNVISIIQLLLVILIIYLYAKNNYIRDNEYYSVFLFSIMIISLSFDKGIIFKLTNNIVGDWLGRISYSIYLLHPVCIVINKKLFSDFFGFTALITYIISILFISIITHLFIENKSMLFFKKRV